jgi:hypothetical protein
MTSCPRRSEVFRRGCQTLLLPRAPSRQAWSDRLEAARLAAGLVVFTDWPSITPADGLARRTR